MKTRQGFVSNSSSSSFIVVGVSDEDFCSKLLAAMKIYMDRDNPVEGWVEYEPGFGVHEGKPFDVIGSYDYVSYVGFDIESDLKKGTSLNLLKKKFVELAKKIGVEVPISKVDLHYGASSSE